MSAEKALQAALDALDAAEPFVTADSKDRRLRSQDRVMSVLALISDAREKIRAILSTLKG